jgi:arylsulfatase A-like enzyme
MRFIFLFLFFITCYSTSWADRSGKPPNIILFLVDDLGWKDLGCYGSSFYETPHIDRLAAKSVRFTDAYAACHVCSPTRASIMTGKYPARLQLTDWLPGRKDFPFQKLKNAPIPQQLPLSEVTLAEVLKTKGYRTAHLGKWHLGEEPFGPLAQGFDLQIPRWNKGWPKIGFHGPFQLDGLESKDGDYLTDRLTDEAERFIEGSKDTPFFLYLSHFAVHDPIEGRSDYVQKYATKRRENPANTTQSYVLEGNPDDRPPLTRRELENRLNKPAWSGYRVLPNRTVKIKQTQDNAQFAAMVSSMDESMGRIIAKLDSLGLTNNTMIVFCSDNGGMSAANFGRPNRTIAPDQLDVAYSTSNLPLRGAKGWLYEGGIRVPLIIRLPGESREGTTNTIPVISNDLFPTILEAAGMPLRSDLHRDGLSLVPLMRDPTVQLERSALFWHFPHYSNHGMQSPSGAIRAGDYKLIEYFENQSVQLFHLRDDLEEQKDLSASLPEMVAELRNQLQRWRSDVGAQAMELNPDYQVPKANP